MIGIFILIILVNLALSTCPYDSLTVSGQISCNKPKFMVDSKICAYMCPSLFPSDSQNCGTCYNYCSKPSGVNAILFTLNFFEVQNLSLDRIEDSSGSDTEFLNPGGVSYNNPIENSPLPTLDRGFYFAQTSAITCNKNFIPGLYFTLDMWIKPLQNGDILNVKAGSNVYIRIWVDNGFYNFEINYRDSSVSHTTARHVSTASYSSSWHYTSLYFNQINCNTCEMGIKINRNSAGSTTLSICELSVFPGTNIWTIGKNLGGASFRGFLYWLQARVDTDDGNPTITPTIECLDKQYWDGTSCQNCDANCQTWPWCIRGSDCKVCYTSDCITCSGYASDMCSSCTTGIIPRCCDHLGTACTQTWANTACNNGVPDNAGVCLYGTPYGWSNCGGNSCFTVLTADFNAPFTGIYSSSLISGTSSATYNYWNSAEISDPFPAKNRGLYFNSNQFLSGSINLSNTWSMGIWAFAISGTIISHSTNKFTINSSGAINFDLEKWDGTSASYSASVSITSNKWSYISYSVGFANKATIITPYLNNVAGTAVSVTDYVFRLADGQKLYIGKGSSNLNGFISYFQLWGTTISDFSISYNLYGFTGSLVSTLWSCYYSHYYDGSVCQPCLGTCTMGCTRGTSCYICDDFLCSQCSSFSSGACTSCISNASGTPCQCNSGYYQPINQALCLACYSGCATCTGSLYSSCTSCNSGYFLYNSMLCLPNCPTGYDEISSTNNCYFSSDIGLSLNFYDVIKLDYISGNQVGATNNVYPVRETSDPYPWYLQGYFFKSDSYILTKTVIGPYFTISIWINPLYIGPVVTKKVSGNMIFGLDFSGWYPCLSLVLSDSSSVYVKSAQLVSSQVWSFIAFTGKIEASSAVTITSFYNSLTTASATSSTKAYFKDKSIGTLYIGKANTGFTGSLYDVNIFNSENFKFSDYTTIGCASPCTQCPSDHNCPRSCQVLWFYNGSTCENCSGSCTTGCRYSSSIGSCTLCKTPQCYQCESYSGPCSSCIQNAESDGSGGCKCKADTFWNSGSCTFCDKLCSNCKWDALFECTSCIAGMQIINDICLNDCPYGYGASCTVVSTVIIDQLFDIDFQGSYGIFTTGTSFSTYQPFTSPESADPIPAYKRGLYFDGNMYLLSSISVYLSHSFSMSVWSYALQVNTKGAVYVGVEDNLQTSSVSGTIGVNSPLKKWNYLSIVVAYTSSGSILIYYLNGSSVWTKALPSLIFRDQQSTKLQLGKGSSTGFIGFLYYFQLWNVRITDFLSIMNEYTFCGAGLKGSCLPECIFSKYPNESSCLDCSSCPKGCVRENNCNICYDTLCLVCTGFGAAKCSQCVANAYLSSGLCICSAAFGLTSNGLSCATCPIECSLCTEASYQKCTSCVSGFFLFSLTGQCLSECPSGYSKNTVLRKCDYTSNIGIKFDLTDKIHLGIVSGFNVGNNNGNNYPNFDDNDPIPAYKRGYYFKFKNYLTSSVMIAPSFTISIWAKPLAAGILVTKYTVSAIFIITVDSSGYPSLSIKFSDSSTKTLTASTSILNSWKLLSFTGQVQSDGKTILNLFINSVSITYIATSNLIYFKDTLSGTLYIGNDQTLGTSGLHGFLSRLMIFNSYNYQAEDYDNSSCGAGCSVCPSNHQCLSECDFDKYPDSCTACSDCSKGCINNLSCNLCRDKECLSCTTFSGECTNCIANAYKPVDHCKCLENAIWVPSSQSCEMCNPICLTCSNEKFNGCLECISGHYLVQSICVSFCPTGYVLNGSSCGIDSNYLDHFVFNLMPHQIKDIVYDLKSNIPILTGKDNNFYPNYDPTDPIPAINRGYYFTGSSYMQLPPYPGTISPLFTFTPKFVITAWIMPILDTGAIFSKQDSNGPFKKFISLELINKAPSLTLTLKDFSTITYTSSDPLVETTLSQWNFISTISSISSASEQTISLAINGFSDTSSDLGASWLADLENSFWITIGACYASPTSLVSFFNGFLWDLKIYNALLAVPLVSSICNGCSLCPIDNSNICLNNCLIDTYWDGNSCASCSSGCSNKGCVRADKNCNLCQDAICEECDDYTSTCIACKANASLIGINCQCNPGYFWNENNEDCELCDIACKTCTSSSSSGCLTCANGYFESSGTCRASCPIGYSESGSGCVLVNEIIFDLDLNTLNGVIYDKASSIPVITGSTEKFYPEYEADDPIAAYLRGFWFNGKSSVLRLPEHSNYLSPKLVIAPTFTISIWLNIDTAFSSILSKHSISNNFSTLYSVYLIGNKPSISLTIGSTPFFYQCQVMLNNYEWSHIVFTLENSQDGHNKLSCYINGVTDSSTTIGSGTFIDEGPHTAMAIGAQINSQGVYNFYQGFIYSIQIFNKAKIISSFSTTSCTENCSVCPTSKICIPNCKINKYWSGPAYNECYHCNNKCTKSCRNWRDTCSLCSHLLCKDCIDYSSGGCMACIENAINIDSCICDANYVLDTSNNSTCIPIMPGGFRGIDGIFYSCPKLCTFCESLIKCTTCVENASLENDLCYCNLGYNGIISCLLVPFTANLTVFSDNSLCLTFSESLVADLTLYDFIVIIEKQGEAYCKLEKVNSTCYYISLDIKAALSKDTSAIFKFVDLKEIRSISNGILGSSDFPLVLNAYDPDPYSPAIAAVASQSTAAAQSVVAGALALSFVSPNPGSLWSIMSNLQILSYLTLSGIPLSSKLSTFLNNLNSFDLFPNIFAYLIDQKEGNTPYTQAVNFGYNTNLILINQGNDFTLLLASVAALPIFLYFSHCSHRWISKNLLKTIKSYQFSFYLRFWIQCYLELGVAASIGVIDFEFSNPTQIANFIICAVVCLSMIITPGVYFWFSYKNKNRILSREKTFLAYFGSCFYEFRTDRTFLATQYYLLFFVRRLIYIINLVYLRNYPQTEVTVNIILSLMTIMHLLFYWPFKDQILQISNLITEILICLIMGSTAAYLFNFESNVISKIENAVVVIATAIIGIQFLSSITIFGRTIYELVSDKLNKAKSKILPIHSQLTKQGKVLRKIQK